MNKHGKQGLEALTEGGDILSHRISLLIVNLFRIGLASMAAYSITFGFQVHFAISSYTWNIAKKVFYAGLAKSFHLSKMTFEFPDVEGDWVQTPSYSILQQVYGDPELQVQMAKVGTICFISSIVGIVVGVAAWKGFKKFGKKVSSDEFIRGQEIVDSKDVVQLIKEPSPLSIGGVPIPMKLLARNVMLCGSMGTGKTVALLELIEQSRKWGKKMVIYDKTGAFTKKFYREGIDIILNPVDARCADWTIGNDLDLITDPALLSTFFVPKKKDAGDGEVWDNLARMLLEDLIQIAFENNQSMSEIRDIISKTTLEELHTLLKNNDSMSQGAINPKNEKGSESVRLTLVAQPAIRFFKFFNKEKSSFSVREFMRRKDDTCLFLSSSPTMHPVCKPFISAWIEIALAEAMSHGQQDEIEAIFAIDELASLERINALDIALSEARQFGVMTIVGFQNIAQVEELYGKEMTKVYLANLQTKMMLRCEEDESAERLAKMMGKREIRRKNSGVSYGADSSKDSGSLNEQVVEEFLVTPTEVTKIPDLEGYLKIAGAFPLTQIKLIPKNRKDIAPAYAERDGLRFAKVELAKAQKLEKDLEEFRKQIVPPLVNKETGEVIAFAPETELANVIIPRVRDDEPSMFPTADTSESMFPTADPVQASEGEPEEHEDESGESTEPAKLPWE